MAIILESDSQTLQEIRYELHTELTAAELPDAVLTSRTVLRAANRDILEAIGLSATAYNALDPTDGRREVCEEAVIKRCAYSLIPRVAQILTENENGLLTRYQQIDWQARMKLLDAAIHRLLAPYIDEDAPTSQFGTVGEGLSRGTVLNVYPGATRRTKAEC